MRCDHAAILIHIVPKMSHMRIARIFKHARVVLLQGLKKINLELECTKRLVLLPFTLATGMPVTRLSWKRSIQPSLRLCRWFAAQCYFSPVL